MKTNAILNIFNEITDRTTVYGAEFHDGFVQDFTNLYRGSNSWIILSEIREHLVTFIRDVMVTHNAVSGKWASYVLSEMLLTYLWALNAQHIQSQKDITAEKWYASAVRSIAQIKAQHLCTYR